MLTILGSFIGFLGSIFPDLVKYFQDRQDKSHELKLFDRQIEVMKLNHRFRVQEMKDMIDLVETQGLYRPIAQTKIKWVDALCASVRPVITYTFFLLYAGVKWAQVHTLLTVTDQMTFSNALIRVWHDEDQALFAAVMSFWFGQRALRQQRRVKR
jgi:hypothetical protein